MSKVTISFPFHEGSSLFCLLATSFYCDRDNNQLTQSVVLHKQLRLHVRMALEKHMFET